MEPSDAEIGNQIRRLRRKRRKTFLTQLFFDYTQNTSLHGLRYTTEKGIHFIEKIFWTITILLSLGMCVYLISNVWHKWKTSPVIVSFSEKILPVESVPFPSLTICPQVKAMTTVYNYTQKRLMFVNASEDNTDYPDKVISYNLNDNMSSPTAEDIKLFQDMSLICPLPRYKRGIKFANFPNITDETTIENILNMSPSQFLLFGRCSWMGIYDYDCDDLFKTVLTKEGVCFNFNGLAASEIFRLDNLQRGFNYSLNDKASSGWDINTGYNDSDPKFDSEKQYPYRGQYSSDIHYLEVIFQNDKNDYDENCNVLNKGLKVYTQHPADHPKSSVYSYAILPGQVSALALKVNMINTSEKLEHYDSKVRQCYFPHEKYLKYFKIYTASNCMLECVSLYTFEKCGCVPFHLPHSDSKHICSMEKSSCLNSKEFKKGQWKRTKDCDCLPSCNSITYNAEILKTEFNMEQNFHNHIHNRFNDSDFDNFIKSFELSQLVVYYRDSGFVTITRSELYGKTDFLANIGGLLGLFLGFSFLSIVEIVYFFVIRLGFIFRKDMRNDRKGTINLGSPTNLEENMTIDTIKVKHI